MPFCAVAEATAADEAKPPGRRLRVLLRRARRGGGERGDDVDEGVVVCRATIIIGEAAASGRSEDAAAIFDCFRRESEDRGAGPAGGDALVCE